MAETENTEKTKSGSGLMGLIKPIGIVVGLVVVEMVGAAILIPSAEETEDLAREMARVANGEDLLVDEEENTDPLTSAEETKEFELVSENITRFDPDKDTVLNIDFVVYGVVLMSEEEEFLEEYEANKGRIKEQIIFTLHNAQASDLSSAGLGLIKRQILEKTNRTLGRPLLREVVFTKINFVER